MVDCGRIWDLDQDISIGGGDQRGYILKFKKRRLTPLPKLDRGSYIHVSLSMGLPTISKAAEARKEDAIVKPSPVNVAETHERMRLRICVMPASQGNLSLDQQP